MAKDEDYTLEDDEEVQATFSLAAESEFKRLKESYKRKAGLIRVSPLERGRMLLVSLLERIRAFYRRLRQLL